MLVTYVITAVIVYLIYTVLKIRIEEWHVGTKMNRLSLKKKVKANVSGHATLSSPTDPYQIIEISSEESDTSLVQKVCDSDQESEPSPSTNEKDDKESMTVFQLSTDSIQSDEETGQSLFGASTSSKIPMFKWSKQKPFSNTNSIQTHVADSSDESNSESSHFRKQPSKKKHKVSQNSEQTVENESKEHKEETVPEVAVQHELMVAGLTVKLPVKPYSCQKAVMGRVIRGCLEQKNCLLESPTGSGKTLALLCSVLAWHDHYTAEIQKKITAGPFGLEDDEHSLETTFMAEFGSTDKTEDFDDMCCSEQSRRIKIPKIYYGTRTHAQIEQLVRELKKTCYKHKKMTILSSRKYTCIQESTKNKTELCNDLLDVSKNIGCPYYKESNKKMLSNFPAVERRGLPTAWDIEDLVAIGRNESVCPYFAARNLVEYADIIFCPYNYIIDPDIRESMQLELKDQVIILDEAHNIENICREVASVEFREDFLVAAANECDSLGKQRAADFSTYEILRSYISTLADLLKNISLDTTNAENEDKSSTYWSSEELIELFNMHQLGEPAYTSFLAASSAAIADSNKAKDESRQHLNQKKPNPVISHATKTVIDHLLFAMRMIKTPEFTNDFKACVLEIVPKDLKSTQDDTWYSTDKRKHRVRILKFICMNPAVTFSPLSRIARCIILASGTLSPSLSFQSELGTPFEYMLNTGHVISKEQVYATCVPKGPTQFPLKANYLNVNTWAFQDELGRVLLDVCESVPHGILCFFSSYSMMHKQLDRWRNNQIWNKITKIKEVFIEPRSGDDLKDMMKDYGNVIRTTSAGPKRMINGALLLAVFRGKVAEGTDFKDDEARCVIAVGIPYAVRKDPVIDMKYKYNDMNAKRGLLNGSDWYTTQAFRALNQALGRCLRHIHDWAAVLLVDQRFTSSQNTENLPKWVKAMWVNQNNYNLRENLRNFVAKQKERERKEGRALI